MNKYSVPARMVGRQARVLLNASDLVVFDGRTEIARHERLMTKGSTRGRPGPLSRGPPPQTGRATRCESAGAGQGIRAVYARSRRLVGRGLQGPR